MKTVRLDVRLVNALNAREHWRKRAHRAKEERLVARLVCPRAKVPCRVTLTKHGFGVMDGDGLQACFKNIRDGIADALQVNDADPRVTWVYRQQREPRGEHWITITIEPT